LAETSLPRLSRVVLKLSGESLCAPGGFGVDPDELARTAREVASACAAGAQVAVVVGGGNIVRGAKLAKAGLIHQATADAMGMLGTIINGLALREALEQAGCAAACLTAAAMPSIAELYTRGGALAHLKAGRVVICSGGVGNPFFTTDSGAALRAIELDADAVLKATKVDGVYTADPKKDPTATRYETLTYDEALAKRLEVMDMTALALCREHRMPTLVFNFDAPGNIRRAVEGGSVGTLLTAS